ncbi:MAG: hypothetical protein LUG99_01450, partial [Lachnospiraceae bacterium]|nr:hypothetical protein [Lachnospiraceae bacterium]
MKRKKQWALLMAAVMLTVTPASTALANDDTVIIIDDTEDSAVAEDAVAEETVSEVETEEPVTAADAADVKTEDPVTVAGAIEAGAGKQDTVEDAVEAEAEESNATVDTTETTADVVANAATDAIRGEDDGISIISVEPVEEVPSVVADEAVVTDASEESAEIEINATNFPDEIFREYVSEKLDEDGSGGLNAEEIEATKSISVSKLGISSLEGIEYFTELKSLYCDANNLSSLDMSRNTALTDLYCPDNNLSSLNVS